MTNIKIRSKLTEKQMEKISGLYYDYNQIYSVNDMRIRHLQIVDYLSIPELANNIQRTGEARTFMQNVAEYFKRFGFTVTMDSNNVNYKISI